MYFGPADDTHKGEPRKNQVERLVNQLYMYPRFAHERMRAPIDVCKVDGAVDRRKE